MLYYQHSYTGQVRSIFTCIISVNEDEVLISPNNVFLWILSKIVVSFLVKGVNALLSSYILIICNLNLY